MEERQKMRQVSVKIPMASYQYLDRMAFEKRKSKSQLISDMIAARRYADREEVTANTVELMDAIHDLEGKCDEYLYERVRKAGKRLCQSLLIN